MVEFDDMATDHAPTLGELVLRRPRAAALFERLGLDYCCGGARTLEEACAARGLDPATVSVLVDTLGGDDPADVEPDHHDIGRATIGELCDHIVAAHHDLLRRELPHVSELVATVVRVHGPGHPELHDVGRVFDGLRAELEEHMAREEADLFPACRALDAGATIEDGLIEMLEHDHDATGDALASLRELCGGYHPGDALCGTHRALLQSLHALELDVHQHVHEENNVLFPRVRALLAA
jgi:regulator of cell morphogenesis and NO signaling